MKLIGKRLLTLVKMCVCVYACVHVFVCMCVSEMGSGSIPENWDTHTDNEHVKVVSLAQTDSEYQKVEANFRATLGNNRGTLTITAVMMF